MNTLELGQSSSLIWELEERYSNINSLADLVRVCYELEDCLKSICIEKIQQSASHLFNNINTRNSHGFMVSSEGVWYSISGSSNLYDSCCLNISINRINGKSKLCKIDSANIYGTGQYTKIILYVAEELKVNKSNIIAVITTIYNTGYAWYKNKVSDYIHRESVSVAREVYTYLKNTLQNDTIYKRTWLAIVGKGYGFRLLNDEHVEDAFDTYQKQKSGISGNCFLMNLISTRLPYRQILMKEALNYDTKITANLKKADYAKSGDLYALTLFNLYGGDAFSIFPLYKGEISLVALYPVEVKEYVEIVLEKNKSFLKQVYLKYLKKIELAFLLFNESARESKAVSLEEMEEMLEWCSLKGYIDKVTISNKKYLCDTLCAYDMLMEEEKRYILTEYGKNVINERRKTNLNIQVINNNSGIATNGGENNENILNQCTSMGRDVAIEEAIKEIRAAISGQEEEEYVNNAMDMLEKEMGQNIPRPNLLNRILASIEGIVCIGDKLVHLKNLLKLVLPK